MAVNSTSPARPEAGPAGTSFRLTPEQLELLRPHGTEVEAEAGTALFRAGDESWDMVVVLEGRLEILEETGGGNRVVTSYGPRYFAGELGLLTGRRATLSAVVAERGRFLRVPLEELRAVVADDRELSELILDAFVARRGFLVRAGIGLTLIGSRFDEETRQLLELLARNRVACTWLDCERSPDAARIIAEHDVGHGDLPVVVVPGGTILRRPTAAELRRAIGVFDYGGQVYESGDCDLIVVGAGPGGLAAAVYGASEGLATTLLEGTALGGQAGTSSRIENYLGFPAGLSGAELTARGVVQAQKFGVRLRLAGDAVALSSDAGRHVVTLDDGDQVAGRALIIATGAHYRRLPLDRIHDFEGVGVYYAATQLEAEGCLEGEVAVVGGGNSAGQAALYLTKTCRTVHLILRRRRLEETMSRYLIDRIERDPRIRLLERTEVRRLHGDGALTAIDVEGAGGAATLPVCALFLFIGATPCTEWLGDQLAVDEHGFILTGTDVPARWIDGPQPLPLETSTPGIFCVGDARSGSVKRVATAIGEGSMAVRLVFDRLPAVSTA